MDPVGHFGASDLEQAGFPAFPGLVEDGLTGGFFPIIPTHIHDKNVD